MYRYIFLLLTLASIMNENIHAQSNYTKWFTEEFLSSVDNKDFQKILNEPDKYRLQIIYTQIDRDKNNQPAFTNHYFNVNEQMYFNPASTVKFPLALLSLDKLNRLKEQNISKYTRIAFDSAYSKQTKMTEDKTSENGYPSIAHYIKKAFLVSDNDAYNRMYEFVGQQEINRSLHSKGYDNVRIMHRFVPMSIDENRHTNPVSFYDENGNVLFAQPMLFNQDAFDHSRDEKLGNAYMDANDNIVQKPFDFSTKNRMALEELHNIMRSVMFPESVKPSQRFHLTQEDYTFLYHYLSQFPGETNYPKYDGEKFYDSFVKFFFRDSTHKTLPEGVRVFNKVGWAYGFLTDISYVADFKNNVEYLLSATIYVNEDGILNDGNYEYESTGHPFFFHLGKSIYEHELQRERKNTPNLDRFKVNYEKRLNDDRATITEVDN